jgi:hypothetical protein
MWLRAGQSVPDDLKPIEAQALTALRDALAKAAAGNAANLSLSIDLQRDSEAQLAAAQAQGGCLPDDRYTPTCSRMLSSTARQRLDDWYAQNAQTDNLETYLFGRDLCSRYGPDACKAQFSAARWAQLAPDNGAAWIAAAAEAQAANDTAAAQEALRRAAASSTHISTYTGTLRMGEAALSSMQDPLQQGLATRALWGIVATTPLPGYSVVGQYCALGPVNTNAVHLRSARS